MKGHLWIAPSGEILEGHKVSFLENEGSVLSLPDDTIPGAPAHSYKMTATVLLHDGWVLFNPEMNNGIAIFMNRESEKLLEYVGEM